MPSERSIEITRRVVDSLQTLSHAPGQEVLLVRQLTRANVIVNGEWSETFDCPVEANQIADFAAHLDALDVVSPEVIARIFGMTDMNRIRLFEKLLAFEERRVPKMNGVTEGFPFAFHKRRGKMAEFINSVEPDVAAQHLRLASDFFTVVHRLRQDFASPANKIGVELLIEGVQPPFDRNMQQKLLLHTLKHYGKLVGDPGAHQYKPIVFPRIPSFQTRHIDVEEFDQLALEILRFIITGNADSPLLQRKNKEVTRPIADVLKTKFKRGPEQFRRRLQEASDRALIVVETDQRLTFTPLSFLPDILQDEGLQNDPVVQELNKWPMLLVKRGAAEGKIRDAFKSWFDQNQDEDSVFRRISLKPGMFNSSVGMILHDVCASADSDFGKHALLAQLIGKDMPGITTPEQFLQSVRSARGTESMEDILNFFFSALTDLQYPRLLHILETLFHHRIVIPQACKQQIIKRFNVDPPLLDSFNQLGLDYHPVILTSLPEDAVLHTSVSFYLSPPPEMIGLEPEADALAEKLSNGDVVSLVDTTIYNQADHDDDDDDDSDNQGYIDPLHRAINAFTHRLMLGKYPQLSGYSVVTLTKEDEFVSLLLILFGGRNNNDDDDDDDDTLKSTDDRSEIRKMEDQLMALKRFNDKIILLVEPNIQYDVHAISTIVKYLKRFGIKIIYASSEAAAGMSQVLIEPFTQNEVSARFENAAPAIQTVLNADIHPDLLRRIPLQVERLRQDPLTDPLDLSVDVLFGASAAARARMPDAYSRACITGSDITTALASVFHTVDPQRLKAITAKIELLYSQLSSAVFGQEEMIERLIAIFGDHFKGLRPAHRPSAVLMTGATGVGKTEVIKAIAKFFGIPYMCLEGGDFTESHHVDMLTGSPPGYKDEGDGILTNFMSKHHEEAIVFIDEIDKAHLSFRRLIMNTLWTGGLRNKHGFDRHRPGYVYVAASNAGSDQITPDMELRKIHEVLAKAFSTKGGDTQPEFIARFELVHAHPIAEKPFRDAIEWILRDMESFPALQNFDVHVRNIDPAAVQHIFDQINNTCTYKQNSAGGIGFEQGRASNAQERKYFNLRQISFAMLHAIRESASSLVEQLTRDGASSLWAEGKVRNVDIVQSGGSIELRPIA